jgi:hypothetical protein
MLQQRTNIASNSFPKTIIVVLPARCHRLIQGARRESEVADIGRKARINIPTVVNVTSSACRSGFDYK